VRLYGQRLREQSADGAERWQQTIAGLSEDSPTSSVICDLFLESLFLASNAAALLERSWPALCANGGRLLNRMRSVIGAKANTPEAANNLLKVLRVVLNHAVSERMIASNPALGIKRY
jgi:hypothetical protein